MDCGFTFSIHSYVLWTLGVHGANIIEPFMQTINLPAIEANVKAISSGEIAPYIVNKPFFDAFINMGGSGTTIALIIAIFILLERISNIIPSESCRQHQGF